MGADSQEEIDESVAPAGQYTLPIHGNVVHTMQLLSKSRTSRQKKKIKRLWIPSSGSESNKKKSKKAAKAFLTYMKAPKTPKALTGVSSHKGSNRKKGGKKRKKVNGNREQQTTIILVLQCKLVSQIFQSSLESEHLENVVIMVEQAETPSNIAPSQDATVQQGVGSTTKALCIYNQPTNVDTPTSGNDLQLYLKYGNEYVPIIDVSPEVEAAMNTIVAVKYDKQELLLEMLMRILTTVHNTKQIIDKQDNIEIRLAAVEKSCGNSLEPITSGRQIKLPIGNLEELEEAKKNIKANATVREQLVLSMSLLGGRNLTDVIARILRALMSKRASFKI